MSLPNKLSAREIQKITHGDFAAHSFVRKDGFSITALSDYSMQLRKKNEIENIRFKDTPSALETEFRVTLN